MDEYIAKTALYGEVAKLEELARNRYLETPIISPAYTRYTAQMQDMTAFKHLIADFPAADVEPVQQWIPVTERLPETCVAVLARCFYHGKWMTLVCHTSKENFGEWYTDEVCQWVKITHWMPIPVPPKGE